MRNSRKLRCRSAAKSARSEARGEGNRGGRTEGGTEQHGSRATRDYAPSLGASPLLDAAAPSSVLPPLRPRVIHSSCASPPTSKYHPELADAVNLQGLLDQLERLPAAERASPAARRRSGTTTCPTASARMDALRQAILQALMDSGQLTPEMLKVLRGESTGRRRAGQGDRARAQRAARQDRPAPHRRGLPQRDSGRRRLPVDVRPRRCAPAAPAEAAAARGCGRAGRAAARATCAGSFRWTSESPQACAREPAAASRWPGACRWTCASSSRRLERGRAPAERGCARNRLGAAAPRPGLGRRRRRARAAVRRRRAGPRGAVGLLPPDAQLCLPPVPARHHPPPHRLRHPRPGHATSTPRPPSATWTTCATGA